MRSHAYLFFCMLFLFRTGSLFACTPQPEILNNGIDEDCNGWIETTQYRIKAAHPRLLIDDERKPAITARITDSSRAANQLYRELLSYAVSKYDDPVGTGYYDYPASHLITFAFIYGMGQIDGFDYGGRSLEQYGSKAIEWLRAWADSYYNDGPRNDYAASEAVNMSLAYDWLHPLLTVEEKAYILPRLISIAEQMHRFDCKYWFSDYTLGCYTFTAVGMAILGENVDLDFTVQWNHYSNPEPFTYQGSSDQKALEYTDLFVSQYIEESFEMWKFAGMGGGSFQSMTGHSGDIMFFTKMFDMWHTATGEEYLSQLDLFTSWPEWWTYGTVPYLKNMSDTLSNSGDALLSTDNESMYNLLVPLKYQTAMIASKKLTTMPGFEEQAGLFNWFLGHHAHRRYSMENSSKIFSIIWHDDAVASRGPEELNLPLTRLFGTLDGGDILGREPHCGGSGIVIMKSAWEDPDATLAMFKPRPFYFLHQDVDSNSFVIYRKGYLAIDSGKYINGDWNSHERNYTYRSIAHNVFNVFNPSEEVRFNSSIVSNDGGQRIPSVSPRIIEKYTVGSSADIGGITGFESVDDRYDFIEGDATRAYQSTLFHDDYSSPKVTLAKRQFVYLRSPQGDRDFFVIHDKIGATDPSFQKSWLFHSIHRPDFEQGPTGGQSVNGYGGTAGTYYGGNRFSVYDKGGRLFVNTLYPSADRAYKLIGGPDDEGNVNTDNSYEFYVNGQQYSSGVCTLCRYRPFIGAWRIEEELTEPALYHNNLHVLSPRDIEGVIVDNGDAGFTTSGSWSSRTSGLEYYGTDFASASGSSSATATWTPSLNGSGDYHVEIMWNDEHNCTGVDYTVNHSGGSDSFSVDHTVVSGIQAGDWYRLGTFNFASDVSVTLTADAVCPSYQYVVADAVRFVKADQDIFANQPSIVGVSTSGDDMVGALMPDDKKAVLFAKEDDYITQAQFSLEAPGIINILMIDVKPNTRFALSDNGQMIDSVDSSANGTLFFDTLDAQAHTITVSADGSLIPAPPKDLHIRQ